MTYDVKVHRTGHSAIIDLKGREQAIKNWIGGHIPDFPETPNTASSKDGLELYWIGADHWLLRAPLDREEQLLETLDIAGAPEDVSAVLVSDTLAFFSILGADAREIMVIASPLDIDAPAFVDNGVSYSEAFGLKALIVRCPDGYELAVERSYGDMTEDFLRRANAA